MRSPRLPAFVVESEFCFLSLERQIQAFLVRAADLLSNQLIAVLRPYDGLPFRSLVGACLVALSFIGDAKAETLCRNATRAELEEAIKAHNDNVKRFESKFRDIWVYKGPLPASLKVDVDVAKIREYLGKLHPRRAAVLFHAVYQGRLCTWIITRDGEPQGHVRVINQYQWSAINPHTWQRLGKRGVETPRLAVLDDAVNSDDKALAWEQSLQRVSELLIPDVIQHGLSTADVDTLIIVPITLRDYVSSIDDVGRSTGMSGAQPQGMAEHETEAARLTLAISAVPFSALPLRQTTSSAGGNAKRATERLLDKMSVLVAPGFFVFSENPRDTQRDFTSAIVIGNPANRLPKLPGAEAEAKKVAEVLNVKTGPLIGPAADKAALVAMLMTRSREVDLVHLATHGMASAKDPLDGSYLAFASGDLTAREISNLGQPDSVAPAARPGVDYDWFLARRPIVVMSACQTARGRDFGAGTTGLARAWWWVGASNVVMTLWSVDDWVTRDLMQEFVARLVSGMPADKAIQAASKCIRETRENYSYWAGFSVFGAPETLPGDAAVPEVHKVNDLGTEASACVVTRQTVGGDASQ
jgi:hypothetical protein